jgi:hypothetical protein
MLFRCRIPWHTCTHVLTSFCLPPMPHLCISNLSSSRRHRRPCASAALPQPTRHGHVCCDNGILRWRHVTPPHNHPALLIAFASLHLSAKFLIMLAQAHSQRPIILVNTPPSSSLQVAFSHVASGCPQPRVAVRTSDSTHVIVGCYSPLASWCCVVAKTFVVERCMPTARTCLLSCTATIKK